MSYKYRIEITKNDSIRYISHLDFASLMQRAICRSKLPAAYSEGFNPHMKIAFASALGVGTTSKSEYMDMELTREVCQPEVFDRLRANLPEGVNLLQVKLLTGKTKPLMSIVDLANYEITLEKKEGYDVEKIKKALKNFHHLKEAHITRQTPKKTKEIELKQYIPSVIELVEESDNIIIKLSIKITHTGTAKPEEILKFIDDTFHLNLDLDEALICRTGLYSGGKALIDAT